MRFARNAAAILASLASLAAIPAFALTATVTVTSVDAKDSVVRQAMVGYSVTGMNGVPPTGQVIVTVTGPNPTAQCTESISAGNGGCEAIFNPHGGNSTATAFYTGDSNYDPATSAPVTFFNPVMTQVSVSSSPSPSQPGQLVTLTAQVRTYDPADAGSFGSIGGTMNWFVDTGTPCTNTPVVNGTSTCNVVFTALGSHFVSATYSGDSSYGPSEGETNPSVTAGPPASITFASSANPSALWQPVILRATFSGAGATPTGNVVFKSGGLAIHGCENVAIYNGVAGCSTGTMSAGDHAITAAYGGDANYPSSTASLTQTVTSTPFAHGIAKARDFSGDGAGDIVWRGADGSVSVWLMDGVNVVGRSSVLPAATSVFPATIFTGDFDGDGKADIIRQLNDGSTTIQLMNGVDIVQATVLRGPTPERLVGVADFDGDGKADLVWRQADGTLGVWLMNGTAPSAKGTVGATSSLGDIGALVAFPEVIVADFNGDGRADILDTRYGGAPRVVLMTMDGTTATSTTTLMDTMSSGWYALAAGDLNGDGNADIVWVNVNHATSAWLMNGATILQRGPLLPAESVWRVAAVGDFNGDGKSDLMFRNSTDGSVGRWFMDGLTPLQKNTLLPAGTPWAPAAALDVNGDAYTDMLWRANDGSVGLWIMGDPALPYVPPRRTLLGPNGMWSLQQ